MIGAFVFFPGDLVLIMLFVVREIEKHTARGQKRRRPLSRKGRKLGMVVVRWNCSNRAVERFAGGVDL